jgi:hypothetical protein
MSEREFNELHNGKTHTGTLEPLFKIIQIQQYLLGDIVIVEQSSILIICQFEPKVGNEIKDHSLTHRQPLPQWSDLEPAQESFLGARVAYLRAVVAYL